MILNGKDIAEQEKRALKQEIQETDFIPGVATILVGDDPASHIYVNAKIKACAEVGIASFPLKFPKSISTQELLKQIEHLNKRKDIHGILVQLPLPSHISQEIIIEAILPEKDVDCFHPLNLGRLFSGDNSFTPCTPAGILHLIGTIPHFSLESKKSLIIGTGNIVGKPTGILLLEQNATVSYAHRATKDLKELTLWADIIISATGQVSLVKEDMVRKGTVLIDVGIHRTKNGTIVGDIDFVSLKDKALAITPVPGGVGPMTILYLLKNTLILAHRLETQRI